ncbi:chemotaxis protein CheW [Vreelandella aquamarina]
MNPLLQSFINEARDNLEVASRCLLVLEKAPADGELLDELFRAMHTIKGASGLFENLSDFSRLLHVIEDGLDKVRDHTLALTPELTDCIFDALDVATQWLGSIEASEALPASAPVQLSEQLGALNQAFQAAPGEAPAAMSEPAAPLAPEDAVSTPPASAPLWVRELPDGRRRALFEACPGNAETPLLEVVFTPPEECFFQGHDPLQNVKTLDGLQVLRITLREPWPALETLDPFRCVLDITLLALADEAAVRHHFRYLAESLQISTLPAEALIHPAGEQGESDDELFVPFAAEAMPLAEAADWQALGQRLMPLRELCGERLYQHSIVHWLALALRLPEPPQTVILGLIDSLATGGDYQPRAPHSSHPFAQPVSAGQLPPLQVSGDQAAVAYQILQQQLEVLQTPVSETLFAPRLATVEALIRRMLGHLEQVPEAGFETALQAARTQQQSQPLASWLESWLALPAQPAPAVLPLAEPLAVSEPTNSSSPVATSEPGKKIEKAHAPSHTIRVEQQRIDELMTLAGELVVAKNALPFLAKHASEGMTPNAIAKELTSHYANIDRIAERMQQAVMGARMVPLSVVFQRFPRLVRDMTRKLDKNAELVLEGEDVEADKHVVDHLADPLVHLVRNSLDHALEGPAERQAAGKPAKGMIKLRAQALDDQVLIEVIDDGRGIDAEKLKQKAYQRGLIDEQKLDTITHQEALQLIFAAGLSTAEKVSDISGRGVGMDAVRTAVAASGGTISVASEPGQGTTLRILLPLSMAVARVMMIRIGEQDYGIAMSSIRETVRVPASAIHRIKRSENIVLRDKLIPLKRMRSLLGLEAAEAHEEEAVLIVEHNGEQVGLVIDDFRQGMDVVQKPMEGIMAGYSLYAGSALMGDGRVLLIINLAALLSQPVQASAEGGV